MQAPAQSRTTTWDGEFRQTLLGVGRVGAVVVVSRELSRIL